MTGHTFVRWTSTGEPEFVQTNSHGQRYHHHRHHTRRCFDDCAAVPRTEYNSLLERNRDYRDRNESLRQDKATLKFELRNMDSANRAFMEENARLAGENETLRAEIARLGQPVPTDDGEVEVFKHRIKVLERELGDEKREMHRFIKNSETKARVLEKQLSEIIGLASQWKAKWEDAKQNLDGAKRVLATRDAQLDARDQLIDEQKSRIDRLRFLLQKYKGW